MAVGWMAVLKSVPWGVVLARAPDVADSARKLWNSVGRQQISDAPPGQTDPAADNQMAVLDARLDTTEQSVAELREQMNQCTGLVAQLAEQNSVLVARVEVGRRRMIQLTAAAGISLILALFALAVAVQSSAR